MVTQFLQRQSHILDSSSVDEGMLAWVHETKLYVKVGRAIYYKVIKIDGGQHRLIIHRPVVSDSSAST